MDGIEQLSELNPEALLADGLEEAFIGFTLRHPFVAVYSYEKCIRAVQKRDDCSLIEAVEFLEFNTLCAYVGENGPLFVATEYKNDD